MATGFRVRPAHLVVLALALPPAWKLVEWGASRSARASKALDPKAVASGETLFNHTWTVKDPMAGGDGLGPVFNARSCVECHNQGGVGGGGPSDLNVTIFGVLALAAGDKSETRAGVVHRDATSPGQIELLSHVGPGVQGGRPSVEALKSLNASCSIPGGVSFSQRNTPALFGDGLLDLIPEDELHAAQRQNSLAARLVGLSRAKDPMIRGRVARLPDGRLGRFGWKAEFATLNEFVKAACANEIGLSNPGRPQPVSLAHRGTSPASSSTRRDDLTAAQCDEMTEFIRALRTPVRVAPDDPARRSQAEAGEAIFARIGCADCHAPDLGSIAGFYSDLLLHDLGGSLSAGAGSYGEATTPKGSTTKPVPNEWKTPPLWGVADSAPYLHDGRALDLDEAILAHGGESQGVTDRFRALPDGDKSAVIAFLRTLRAPGSPAGKSGSLARADLD